MLGHASVKQTEEYALTEQQAINSEMNILKQKIVSKGEKKTQTDLNEFVNYLSGL